MLGAVNLLVFWEVQTALLSLLLLFTFARSETPCPTSYSGAGALDPPTGRVKKFAPDGNRNSEVRFCEFEFAFRAFYFLKK